MSMILDGSNGVTFNDSSLQGAAASPYVLKNRIINGDMRIDQRNAGASISNNTTGTQFSLDRWLIYGSQASKFNIQQNAGSVTPPTGFTNYLGCTSTSAYTVTSTDEFDVIQRIEGYNMSDFGWGTANAKTVTLSFWARSSLTGTFGGVFGNSSLNRVYVFSYTISAANTWEYKTVTITGDTTGTWDSTNGKGIQIYFSLGCGSTYQGTTGSWGSTLYLAPTGQTSVVGTNGATWYITGVQLEIGTSATPFERRIFGQELILCQRYFQKSYDLNVAIGYVGTVNGSVAIRNANVTNDGCPFWHCPFKVTMRATPTVTTYSYDGTSGKINGPSNATVTATVYQTGFNGFNVLNSSGSSVSLGDYYCNYAASSEL
jgi:hypothetical protein